MIDKITAKIRRYPFQTGIIVGVILCLLLAGFFSLFQDHGRTLAGNTEIIQEDYLRMSINEYSQDHNEALALWRYEHLGNKADQTLKYMAADESVSPVSLAEFADAVGKADKIGGTQTKRQEQSPEGTPTNPRKGLSGVGKVLLIIVGVVVVAAGIFYAASLVKTKNKQKRRSEKIQNFDESPVNMITPDKARSIQENTPDTLFDLDSLFPQNEEEKRESDNIEKSDSEPEIEIDSEEKQDTVNETEDSQTEESNNESSDENAENESSEESETITENEEKPDQVLNSDEKSDIEEEVPSEESADEGNNIDEPKSEDTEMDGVQSENKLNEDDENNKEEDLNQEPANETMPQASNEEVSEDINVEPERNDEESEDNADLQKSDEEQVDTEQELPKETNEGPEPEEEMSNSAEKPLVETDSENDTDNVDELLKMIRAQNTPSDEPILKTVENESDNTETENESTEEETNTSEITANDQTQEEAESINDQAAESQSNDDVLIHYQSQYRIGNDMYDEVFSIDQGDVFRGECGIGIGETLNNTEPKAVTAFEVWLFDKDDIHTATWYLMSDFALSNEGISQRLAQRGKCDRIRKGDLYTLETETLVVDIKILELEYGNEMEEKNSYFTNVVFDVVARHKNAE